MHIALIFRSLAILLMLLNFGVIACTLFAVYECYKLPDYNWKNESHWLYTLSTITFISLTLYFISHLLSDKKKTTTILRREGIAIVGIGWILSSICAMLPYIFGLNLTPASAFFEACSGLTTTGSSIINNIAETPRSILLWRSLTQWLGGMGILGAFLFIFSKDSKAKTLISFESSIRGEDFSLTNLKNPIRFLWSIYICLTLICIIGLKLFDMSLFDSINHAMTTVSTGGFSTKNTSLNDFSATIQVWIMLFMIICGMSFPLYIFMIKKKKLQMLKTHEETHWYLGIIVVSIALVYYVNSSTAVPLREIAFNVIAIITTTGFIVGDYDNWQIFSKYIILILMILGGCAGSTSGGIKISRVILWTRYFYNEIIRGFRPHIVQPISLNGKPLTNDSQRTIFVILFIAVFFFFFGSLIIHAMNPDLSILTIMSATLTCLSNVGPGFSGVGPSYNFSAFSTGSQITLAILMLLGRLEYIALLVLISPKFWKKY